VTPRGDRAGRVRRARPADRAAIAGLQSLLPEPAPELLSPAIAAGDAMVTTVPAIGRPDPPVGYVVPVPGAGVHVAELVVARGHRRSGRATALLEAVLDAHGTPATVLVAADNDPARRLYRSLGFRLVRTEPDEFDGREAVLLRKG